MVVAPERDVRSADRSRRTTPRSQAAGVCEPHELALPRRPASSRAARAPSSRSALAASWSETLTAGVVEHRSPPSPSLQSPPMILENGSSAPWTRRSRSRARSPSQATVSPAASARTSPRFRPRTSSTSAGAASSPASRTRTSTSPPGRSRQRDVRLEGCRVARRGARPGAARAPATAGWIRGRVGAPRLGGAADERGARRGHRRRPRPRSGRRTYHSLWLNSAALALADGDLEVEGGVVERDAAGEPTGVLREEAAWRFRERFASVSEDEWRRGDARGCEARS